MRKMLFLLLGFILVFYSQAQEFSGSWTMGYIKAKQPVFTMIQKNGRLSLEDETPQDSTYIYGPGLMLLEAVTRDSAVSYSWGQEEKWAIEYRQDELRFNGKADTLYGNFDAEGRLVLSSTIDDRPTDYVFIKTEYTQVRDELDIINTQWTVEGEADYLTGQSINFKADSVLYNQQGEFGAEGE